MSQQNATPPAQTNANSPTGAPVVPPAAVPWLVGLMSLAAVGAQTLPPHTLAAQVCHGIIAIGGILGLASPGLRRQ